MDLLLCIFLYDFAFNYMFLLIQTVQKPCNPTDATYRLMTLCKLHSARTNPAETLKKKYM